MSHLENASVYWVAHLRGPPTLDDPRPQRATIRKDSISEFVDEVISKLREYKTTLEPHSLDITMTVLIGKNQLSKVKGRALEEIVKNGWFIIDPATKTHCVSDCCALLELYRSSDPLQSAWGYVKSRGKDIAKKLDIQQGASVEVL